MIELTGRILTCSTPEPEDTAMLDLALYTLSAPESDLRDLVSGAAVPDLLDLPLLDDFSELSA